MPQREKRTLEIEARANDFVSGPFRTMANRAAALAKRWGSAFKKMAKAVTSVRGIVTGFIAFLAVRRAFGFIKGIADDLDFVVKTADRLQATTESLSALTFVAELAGVEFKSFAQGLAIFSKNLENARRGSKLQAEAFQRLGIDIENLPLGPGGRIDLIELLAQASEGMNQLGEGTQKVDALLNAFGRQGSQLGPLLEQGAEAIRAQAAEAERLGLVLDRSTLSRAAEFNDAITRLSASIRGLFQHVFIALAPRASALITELAKVVSRSRQQIVDALIEVGKAFANLFTLAIEGFIEFIRKVEGLPFVGGKLIDRVGLKRELKELQDTLREIEAFRFQFRGAGTGGSTSGGRFPAFPTPPGPRFGTQMTPQEQAFVAQEPELRRRARTIVLTMGKGLADVFEAEFEALKKRLQAFRIRVTAGGAAGGSSPGLQGPPAPTRAARQQAPNGIEEGLQGPKTQLQQVTEEMEELERKRQMFFSRFEQGMAAAIQFWADFGNAAEQAGLQLVHSGLNTIVNGLGAIIARTQSTKEAFRTMAQGILQELSRIIAKLLVVRLVSTATGLFGGGGGGGGSGSSTTSASSAASGAASGAVLGAGLLSSRRTGGTGVIPLLRGNGDVHIHYNPSIHAVDGPSVQRVLVEQRETIVGIVSNGLTRRRTFHAQVRDA